MTEALDAMRKTWGQILQDARAPEVPTPTGGNAAEFDAKADSFMDSMPPAKEAMKP